MALRTGAALHLSRQVTGVLAGYDFTPFLRGQLAALYSWSDASFQIQPSGERDALELQALVGGAPSRARQQGQDPA